MDPENLALAQEEATLTKIRNFLNTQKVKLWEAPYYDTEKKIPCEVRYKFILEWNEKGVMYLYSQGSLHELAVTVIEEVQLPRPHVFQVT